MKLFGKTKKRSRSRRQIPFEEKQKRTADKLYVARIKDDPKLMDLYIERFLGIQIPDPDPVKEARTKLQVAIIDKAIEQINKNPELAKRLSAEKIEEIAGIKVDHSSTEGYDNEGYSRSSTGQFLRRLDELEEIRERLGIRQGGRFLGMDGNTISQILLSVLSAIGVAKDSGGVGRLTGQAVDRPVLPVRKYLVEIDGQMQELSEVQYQAILEQSKSKLPVPGSYKEEEPETQEPLPAVTGDVTHQVSQPGIDDAA